MAPKKTRSTSRSRKLRSASQTGEALTLARPEIAIEEHPPSRHRRPGSKEPGRKANAKKVIEPAPPPYTGPRPDTELVHAVSEVVSPSSGGLAGQNVEYIYSMIRSGEDVNQYSVGGFTPLAVAAIAGDDPLVSLLLEKGADASFASMDRHELPLHHAARLGHRIVCQLLVPPTREAGVLDAANNLGWSPLHLATEAGHTEVAHLLLRGRADVHCENAIYSRVTAAHVAARNHDCDTLEELLDGGANPIAIDSTGLTPLHVAAASCDDRCVALLLRHRADPSLRGGDNNLTAMDMVPPGSAGRFVRILSAYTRRMSPRRTDARFDLSERPKGAIIAASPSNDDLVDDAPGFSDICL